MKQRDRQVEICRRSIQGPENISFYGPGGALKAVGTKSHELIPKSDGKEEKRKKERKKIRVQRKRNSPSPDAPWPLVFPYKELTTGELQYSNAPEASEEPCFPGQAPE